MKLSFSHKAQPKPNGRNQNRNQNKSNFGTSITYVNGFPINWNVIDSSSNDVNVNVFCAKSSSIYDNEFYEKNKELIFFSKNQNNINKYKICCQPIGKTISVQKLNNFVNRLWNDKRYEDIFILFKQFKSLQSVILLDKPKDEHKTARLSNEFLREITLEKNERYQNDKIITFPCLIYDSDLWLNFCLSFFPTFSLVPEFFTFDVLRTLLVLWQHSILTCFQELYEKYKKENNENGIVEFITKAKEAKQSYVYDKGVNIAKQIYNLFCRNPKGYNQRENDIGIEFSICYIESLEQYDRHPGEDGWIIKRLYYEIQKYKKIKKFEEVEIEILPLTKEIYEKPEFTILIATLIPYHNNITWDPWLSKCDRIHSTKNDYIQLFNQKLTDEDRKRILDYRLSSNDDNLININDIVLRTFRIKSLMNNEIYIHNKSFKEFFIDNVYTSSYLQTIKTMSRATIMDALFASDSLNVGTKFVLSLFKESDKLTQQELTLDIMDMNKIFDTLINNMLIIQDHSQLKAVFNNLIKKFGKERFSVFKRQLLDYGDKVLKINESYKAKFSEINQKRYCQMIGACIYFMVFSIKEYEEIMNSSYEERIHIGLYLLEHKSDFNENAFEKHIKPVLLKVFEDIDETKITRDAKYSLMDIREKL